MCLTLWYSFLALQHCVSYPGIHTWLLALTYFLWALGGNTCKAGYKRKFFNILFRSISDMLSASSTKLLTSTAIIFSIYSSFLRCLHFPGLQLCIYCIAIFWLLVFTLSSLSIFWIWNFESQWASESKGSKSIILKFLTLKKIWWSNNNQPQWTIQLLLSQRYNHPQIYHWLRWTGCL